MRCGMYYPWAEDDFPVRRRTIVMYHGTTWRNANKIENSGFRWSKDGRLGSGVYLSADPRKASRYPRHLPKRDRVLVKVEVDVGKVIVIRHWRHPRRTNWYDYRYGKVFDTAWVPPNCQMAIHGMQENCVWDPDRIEFVDVEPIVQDYY